MGSSTNCGWSSLRIFQPVWLPFHPQNQAYSSTLKNSNSLSSFGKYTHAQRYPALHHNSNARDTLYSIDVLCNFQVEFRFVFVDVTALYNVGRLVAILSMYQTVPWYILPRICTSKRQC